MKNLTFSLTFLAASALLLAGCNGNNAADTATTTEAAASADTTAKTTDTAAGMAGMNHGDAADGQANTSPQLAAMNAMMAEMNALKPQGNTDHDFAHMMLAHHRGAVAMADIELRDGKDATMRRLAEGIKAGQTKEIGELTPMAERLDSAPTNYQPQNPADPFTSKMNASMAVMMKNMPAAVADPDMNFNMLMTVHHQSAVDMAKAELAHGKDSKLKALAQQMVTAQEQEIKQFKAWHVQNESKMSAAAAVYECPMQCAGSRSAQPGQCPKCGMDLEKKG